MQIWITDLDLTKSASNLDRNRLQAQLYEGIHVLASLLGCNKLLYRRNTENNKIEQLGKRSVANHPNARLWHGYELQLYNYILIHYNEWKINRKYKTDITDKNLNLLKNKLFFSANRTHENKILPDWVNKKIIESHRNILISKDYEYYSKLWKKEIIKNNYPYGFKEVTNVYK